MKKRFFFRPRRSTFFHDASAEEYVRILDSTVTRGADRETIIDIISRANNQEIDVFIGERLAYVRARKNEILSGIKEPDKENKVARAKMNLDLAENYVANRFRQEVMKQHKKLVEKRAAMERGIFVTDKFRAFKDPKIQTALMAILTGLLGDEKDKSKWEETYRKSFNWSPAEIANLTVGQIREKFPSVVTSEEVDNDKDPEVTMRMNAMMSRAKSLYGSEPEFLEQYKTYLLFTIHRIKTDKNKVTYDDFDRLAVSPEKYHKVDFTGFTERPAKAMSGSQFAKDILGLDLEPGASGRVNWYQQGKLNPDEMQNAILMQIEIGNIPEFLRHPKEVRIPKSDGGFYTVYAMPDVLAIGSDKDYFRVPMNPLLSQALAQKYGMALPTRTIVENIWIEAGKSGIQCTGPNYTHSAADLGFLNSAGFYYRQNEDIREQVDEIGPDNPRFKGVRSGGKKELVVEPTVLKTHRTAFYGLWMANGLPIQVTDAHDVNHTEYAMGTRYLAQMVTVSDGKGGRRVISLREALRDPDMANDLNRLEWVMPPNSPITSPDRVHSTTSLGPFDPDDVYNVKKHKYISRSRLPE
jgi:hypothetical protein